MADADGDGDGGAQQQVGGLHVQWLAIDSGPVCWQQKEAGCQDHSATLDYASLLVCPPAR
jgi:hypothetical protein